MKAQPNFPTLLQPFFTDRLLSQRNASPHTIVSVKGDAWERPNLMSAAAKSPRAAPGFDSVRCS
jgi:hypothetical protein